MIRRQRWTGSIRSLGTDERNLFHHHLLRLDRICRRCRFGSEISNAFIRDYAECVDPSNALVLGCFDGGELRGSGELRSLQDRWCHAAEAAFTVERVWQRRGIGTALMDAVVSASRRLGVEQIHMVWHFTNGPMQRLAEEAGAIIDLQGGDCLGKITVQEDRGLL
jgi:GNAT superfamily N-acetyltransferase